MIFIEEFSRDALLQPRRRSPRFFLIRL